MRDREQRIHDEAAALWRELFGEPPPPRAESGALLDGIMRSLPMRDYERMASPYLRPSQIRGPGGGPGGGPAGR